MEREIPKGFTKYDIEHIVNVWDGINASVNAGIMPRLDMAVENNDPYIDRWFNVFSDGRTVDMCITNHENEKPHLADVVDLWDGSNDTDIENYTIEDLRKIAGV